MQTFLQILKAIKGKTQEITTGGPVQYLFLSTHSFMTGCSHFSKSPVLPEHDSPTGTVPSTVPFSYTILNDHKLNKKEKIEI